MRLPFSGREQRQLLILAGLTIVVGWVYAVYLLGPIRRESAKVAQQLKSAREQLKRLELGVANEASLRQQSQQWNEKMKTLRRFLPSQEELPDVIERLSALANQSKVRIQTIFPQRTDDEAKGRSSGPSSMATEVLIQIDATASFHQLGTFLSLVESGEELIGVSSLRIVSNPREPKRQHVKLVLRAYFASRELAAAREA